jgi:hypothetical protein
MFQAPVKSLLELFSAFDVAVPLRPVVLACPAAVPVRNYGYVDVRFVELNIVCDNSTCNIKLTNKLIKVDSLPKIF